MRYSTKFTLSRDYFSASYDQASRYGSKWLMVERLVGTSFILLGIGFIAYSRGETLLPLALVAIGVVELLSNMIKKYFWLRRQSKSKVSGAEVELVVDDEGIESLGPFSTGRMRWSGIEKVVRTPHGILVWPQTGMYMYLPEAAVGRETIEFIASKVA